MKTSVLVLSALAVLSLQMTSAYAQYLGDIEKLVIWSPECIGGPGMCPPTFESSLGALAKPISKSDIVLVGKIVEARPIQKQNQTEYGIEVDKYIKTTKSFDLITAIGDGIYKEGSMGLNEVAYYNLPIFKKDDRVFVYLNKENNTYKISPCSFAISRNIPTGPPPENMWLTVDKSEYRYGDTIAISGLVKKAYIFESSLRNQDPLVYLTVRNPYHQVYENTTLDVASDGTFSHSFKVKGRLGIDGQYGYDVRIGGTTWSPIFSYYSGHVQSPLQQFKAETREDIKCKSGLELLLKASNGFPACVKPETKADLLKRGWGSTIWPFSSVLGNKISCNSNAKKITPGPYPLQSCPISSPQITLAALNSTGFASMHHTNLFASADNYVLERGHNGTIYYSLGLYYPVVPEPFGDISQRNTNLTNYAQFIHYKTLDLKDLENYPDTTLEKDSQSFATCFETPYGPSCRGELTTSQTVNAFVYDHPGVGVYFDKKSEFLTADKNTTISVTFSAAKDAPVGTYAVILPPGVCSGGLILLTVGGCSYQESMP